MVNNRGWVRIVEAVVAIMIVLTTVIIFIVNKNNVSEQSSLCLSIPSYLDQVTKNDTLRKAVITEDIDSSKSKIESFLKSRIEDPSLDYRVKVCAPNEACLLDLGGLDKIEICAGDRLISSYKGQTTEINPKKIKLFLFRR